MKPIAYSRPLTSMATVFLLLALMSPFPVFGDAAGGFTNANFTISGNIQRNSGAGIPNVYLTMTGSVTGAAITDAFGNYSFANVPMGSTVTITPTFNTNWLECVSVRDIVFTQKHIAGTLLPTPYQWVEADANKSGSITNADILQTRNLILGITNSYASNTSWRFIPSGYVFQNTGNPLLDVFPESATITNITSNKVQNFIGMKIGDATDCEGDVPNTPFTTLTIPQVNATVGSIISIPVSVKGFTNLLGMQYSISYSTAILQFQSITSLNPNCPAPTVNSNITYPGDIGGLSFCMTTSNLVPVSLPDGSVLFNIKFKVIAPGSTGVLLVNQPTKLEVVDANCLPYGVTTEHGSVSASAVPCDSVACIGNVVVPMTSGCNGVIPNMESIIKVYDKCVVPPLDISSNYSFVQTFASGSPMAGNTVVTTFVKKIATGEFVDTCTTQLTLKDNTPPTCIAPADITLTAMCGMTCANYNFTATSNDNCGPVTIYYSHAPNFCFPIGTTTVQINAHDQDNNVSNCSFKVTVLDPLQAISLTCPQNITVTPPAGQFTVAVNYPLAVVNSTCPATTTYSHPMGFAFPCGNTTVTCTSTNGTKTVTCSFTVTVTCPQPSGLSFSIIKTSSATTVPSGQGFVFDINYSVSGNGTAQNVVITDMVDPQLDIINVVAGGAQYSITGNTVKINLGAVASGGTANAQINVRFKPGVTCNGAQVCNTATITGKDGPNDITATSNPVCVTATATDKWVFEKAFVGGNVVDGSTWWRILIRNPAGNNIGGFNLSNIVIKDILPTGAIVTSVGGWGSTFVQAGNMVTIALSGNTTNLNVNQSQQSYFIDVFIKFPSPTFSVGQTVQNDAKMDYTLPCGVPGSKTGSATVKLEQAVTGNSPTKWIQAVINLGSQQVPTYSPGCVFQYNLGFNNPGNTAATNYVIEDVLPDAVKVIRVVTQTPSGGTVTLQYKTKMISTWQAAFTNSPNTTVLDPYGSTFGTAFPTPLVSGDYLTELRWTYSILPAVNSYNNNLQFEILPAHFNTSAALVPGEVVTNNMKTYSDQNPTPVGRMASFTVSPLGPKLDVAKYHVPPCGQPTPLYYPGDIVRFRMVVANIGNQTATNIKLTDILDSKLSYAGNAKYAFVSAAYAGPSSPTCSTLSATPPAQVGAMVEPVLGATSLIWSFPMLPSSCDYQYDYLIIEFDVKIDQVPVMCPWGTKHNTFTASASNATTSPTSNDAPFLVNSIYSFQTRKEVKRHSDPITAFSSTAFIPAGEVADYRLTLQNASNIGLREIKLLDLLPDVNDMTVLPSYFMRMSDFPMFVTAPLAVGSPANPAVSYSTVLNPLRSPELCSGIVEKAGAISGMFSPTAGANKVAVKFDLGNYTLPANSSVEINFSVPVPNSAQVGQMACNSFGATGIPLNSSTCLAPTEGTPACVKVIKSDTCGCGTWTNMTIGTKGGGTLKFGCNEPFVLPCPIGGETVEIKGDFNCSLPGCTPTQMNCQLVYVQTQTLIGNFPCTANIDISLNGNLIQKAGLYQLYFTAFCDGKPCSCIVGMTVKDCDPKCKAGFDWKAIDGCGWFQFTDQSTGSGTLNHQWNFGDGSPISTQQNPAHQYANAGIYTVTLLVQSSDTCETSASITFSTGVFTNCGSCAVEANNCLDFDGSNDEIIAPSPLGSTPTNFTVACWFKDDRPTVFFQPSGNLYRLFGWGGANRFELGDLNGRLAVYTDMPPPPNPVIFILPYSTTNIRDGAWHHVALTYSSGTVNVYFDGAIASGLSNISAFSLTGFPSSFHIGNWSGGPTAPAYWMGQIDEFKIWKTALSANEIGTAMLCGLDLANNNLVLHYPFDEKVGGGNNTGTQGATVTNAAPTGPAYNGTLTNFAQTGFASNWVVNPRPKPLPCSAAPFTFLEGNNKANSEWRFKAYNGSIYATGGEVSGILTTTKPTLTKRRADGSTVWRTVLNLNGTISDFTLTADGCDFLLVGYTNVLSVPVDNKCFVARVDGDNGALQWVRTFNVDKFERFTRIALSQNPINQAFPYVVLGVRSGATGTNNKGQLFYMDDTGATSLEKAIGDAATNEDIQYDLAQFKDSYVLSGAFGTQGVLLFNDHSLNQANGANYPSTRLKGTTLVRYAQPTADGNHLLLAGNANGKGFLARLDYTNQLAPVVDWAVQFPNIKYFTKIIERPDGTVHALGVRTFMGSLNHPVVVGGHDNGSGLTVNWLKYFQRTGDASWNVGDIAHYGVNSLMYSDSRTSPIGFGGRDILKVMANDDFSDIACLVKTENVVSLPLDIDLNPLKTTVLPAPIASVLGGTATQANLIMKNPCDFPPCECVFSNFMFLKKGEVFHENFTCNNNVTYELPCPADGQKFYFSGLFKCAGDCAFNGLNWTVKSPDGATVGSGSSADGKISILLTLPMLQIAGTYSIDLTGKCGTTTCNCKVKFSVPQCPKPCSCNNPAFAKAVDQGFNMVQVLSPQGEGCKFNLVPQKLTVCDKVTWRVAKASDQTYTVVGTSFGNQPFQYSFPQAANEQFVVCMDVVRTVPFSSPVQTCNRSTCTIIDIECGSFAGVHDRNGATCTDGILDNTGFLEGAEEGGLLSGGNAKSWAASGGDPFLSLDMGQLDSNFVQLHGNYVYSDRLYQNDLPAIQGRSKISLSLRPAINTIVAGSELVVRVSETQQDSSACTGACQEIMRMPLPDPDPLTEGNWYIGTSFDSITVNAKYLTVHVENPFVVDDEAFQSVVDIDNVCLRKFNFVQTEEAGEQAGIVFRLFPNPASGLTRIEWNNGPNSIGIERVSIMDQLGRTVRDIPISQRATGVDVLVSDLPAGFYFLKMEAEGRTVGALKLVKT